MTLFIYFYNQLLDFIRGYYYGPVAMSEPHKLRTPDPQLWEAKTLPALTYVDAKQQRYIQRARALIFLLPLTY